MFSKVAFVAIAFFAVAQAGHEAPPAKAVHYNVPSVAKVSYPGATLTKSVETYSAPSIEKTTLITRTITAPLNAPAVKSVTYSAPAAPVAAVAAPVAYAAPAVGYGHAAPAVAYAGYAGYAGHGAHAIKGYAAPTLSLATPQLAYAAAPAYHGYSGGIGGATIYSAPALGYSLGAGQGLAYAAAPAYAAAAPAVHAAPVSAEYGAPAKEAGGYSSSY